jgi:hypothetical protein
MLLIDPVALDGRSSNNSQRTAICGSTPSRGISKFNPLYASLTAFNPKFASLSKFNLEHANFFDSGVFDSFPGFSYFQSFFPSETQVKGHFYPCALSLWLVGEEKRIKPS